MKKIETFLNSGLYLALIFALTGAAWSFYQETPPHLFNIYNQYGLIILIGIITLILIFFENTMYIIPPIIGILFIVNKSNMDLSTATVGGFIYAALAFFLSGFIIHIIRYKVRLKQGIFLLGFFLIALSYVMPLFFIPFNIDNLPTSLIAFLYLGLYLFLNGTMKGNLNYLFKIMMFANLLLTFEVFIYLYRGYLEHPELDFIHRIFSGWSRNLGWANINDMCFYIALTFPGYIYFIFKQPKTYIIWLLMIFPTTAVILSKSRGGVIGFLAMIFLVTLFFILKGNKKHLTHGFIFLGIVLVLSYLGREIYVIWWEYFRETLTTNIDDFSTFRISIYKVGLRNFLDHPLFGAGWASLQDEFPGSRLFMYHSTLVQSLAAMGLFGFAALIVHYTQVIKYVWINRTLEKSLFFIGYLASQIHGLIDNVQYAVPYSVLMVLFLVMFETSEKKTSFEEVQSKYHFITDQGVI